MAQKKLEAISGEELMDMRLEPLRFCVDTLLPQGVCVLGGASKIGKSWMVLDWCVRIAKGEPVLGQATHGGTTLYLCLEDTCRRVQDRLNRLTDEVPANAYFVTGSETLHQGLLDQIRSFVAEHPDTVLVAVDTLQIIRDTEGDQSYANDYQEIRMLKALADELGITVLVVHHVRKMGDQDPLNRLTGSTAISGAADTIMVLDRSHRSADCATLFVTGRDVEVRELELRFRRETCCWEVLSDSLETPEVRLPGEMQALVAFMEREKLFKGPNGVFAQKFNDFAGTALTAKQLKQKMNQYRYLLEDQGVYFENRRSNGQRMVDVYLCRVQDDGDDRDAEILECSCDPVCVPER